jgi:Protein of unknown function (DUF2934)
VTVGAAGSTARYRTASSASATTSPDRQQLIAEAAYFIAERRGFAPGRELEDWARAEAEIDMRLGGLPHQEPVRA